MFEKVLQQTQKTIQHRVQLNINNIQKTLKTRRWKTIVKEAEKSNPNTS